MPQTMEHLLNEYPLKDLAGQLFCPAAFIHDDQEGIKRTEDLIRDHKIGGLTFFHSRASAATNYEKREVISYNDSLQKLKDLISHYQSLSEIPLLISIDAEWGLAMRVEQTPQYPYALTLGAMDESGDDLIYEAALQIGRDLRAVGINYNLAPVADINSNPDNPVIGYRSFGASPEQVWRKAWRYCQGLSNAGIANCLKHFPGHGDTAVDSHLGLPVILKDRASLDDQELLPFRKLIEKGIDSIMIGHLAVPALSGDESVPATLSEKIIQGLLRDEFGFEGVVISDALNMHSVSKLYPEKGLLELKAFEAGNDILCFSENVKEGIAKICTNVDASMIRNSVRRIMALKEKTGLLSGIKETTGPNPEAAAHINRRIAEKSIIALGTATPQAETVILIGDHQRENGFVETLKASGNYSVISVDSNTSSLTLSAQKGVIMALFPPHIKPMNNFGITGENLQLIDKLLKQHNASLFLFGNPYCLRSIPGSDSAVNIFLCGQDLREFQVTAAGFLLGKGKPSGKLPFQF